MDEDKIILRTEPHVDWGSIQMRVYNDMVREVAWGEDDVALIDLDLMVENKAVFDGINGTEAFRDVMHPLPEYTSFMAEEIISFAISLASHVYWVNI